jgi:hypothetical protein
MQMSEQGTLLLLSVLAVDWAILQVKAKRHSTY